MAGRSRQTRLERQVCSTGPLAALVYRLHRPVGGVGCRPHFLQSGSPANSHQLSILPLQMQSRFLLPSVINKFYMGRLLESDLLSIHWERYQQNRGTEEIIKTAAAVSKPTLFPTESPETLMKADQYWELTINQELLSGEY